MNKVIQRLLTFFIGLPLVLGIVFLDPTTTHLLINVVACVFSLLAAIELYKLFSTKVPLLHKGLVVFLTTLMPVVAYSLVIAGSDRHFIDYSNWAFLGAAMILMAVEVFSHNTFEDSNRRIASSIFIVFYCGFLFTFIPRLTLLKQSTIFISLFLFTVFINDSLAWFFGVLLGKNNRGFVAASPNKSIAGFIGGYIGSMLSCTLAQIIWSEIFTGPLYKGLVLGFICATAAIIGDLIESVFKRSAEIKDSGKIIPGRGGVLDSVDSILFTAPIFYIFTFILFNPEFIK